MMRVTTVADEAAAAAAAAARISALIENAIAARGSAIVCLTGGRTPERLYRLLADATQPWRGRIEWPRVHLFWGDERHVPPDHRDSNYGMAHTALIAHVPVPPAQVHRMAGERPVARDAAREYEQALTRGFAAAGRSDGTFDVMLLGLGEDAHIASIFPASPLLGRSAGASAPASDARVAAIWAEHLQAWRITLTPPAILDARAIVMLVAGASKAEAVRAALEMPEDVSRFPAQLLRDAADCVEWIVDEAAAAAIDRPRGPSVEADR